MDIEALKHWEIYRKEEDRHRREKGGRKIKRKETESRGLDQIFIYLREYKTSVFW